MILKQVINNYVFMADEGSTFVEWYHRHSGESGHFNYSPSSMTFEHACQFFYNDHLAFYEIKLIKDTACLELVKGSDLIDWNFYNKFEFEEMSYDELVEETKKLAERNNIKEFAYNFEELVNQ